MTSRAPLRSTTSLLVAALALLLTAAAVLPAQAEQPKVRIAAPSHSVLLPVTLTVTDQADPTASHAPTEGVDVPVGYTDRDSEGALRPGRHRVFATVDLSELRGSTIESLSMSVVEARSRTCPQGQTQVWLTADPDGPITWADAPQRTRRLVSYGPQPCPDTYQEIGLEHAVRQALAAGRPTVTVEVAVPGHPGTSPRAEGRRLAGRGAVFVTAHISTPPSIRPGSVRINEAPCPTEPPVLPAEARLSVVPVVPDGGAAVVEFRMRRTDGPGQPVTATRSVRTTGIDGSVARVNLDREVLSLAGRWAWQARVVQEGSGESGWSRACAFVVDLEPPGQLTVVGPGETLAPGAPAHIVITGAAPDVACVVGGFGPSDIYGECDGSSDLGTPDSSGRLEVDLVPPGPFATFAVRAVDHAGYVSHESRITVRVQRSEPRLPESPATVPVGVALDVPVIANDTVRDVVAVRYSLDGRPPVDVAATGREHVLTFTFDEAAVHYLEVSTIDSTGFVSGSSFLTVIVGDPWGGAASTS